MSKSWGRLCQTCMAFLEKLNYMNRERSEQFLKQNCCYWRFLQIEYIGTTKVPIVTNNWNVWTYRNKLENPFWWNCGFCKSFLQHSSWAVTIPYPKIRYSKNPILIQKSFLPCVTQRHMQIAALIFFQWKKPALTFFIQTTKKCREMWLLTSYPWTVCR